MAIALEIKAILLPAMDTIKGLDIECFHPESIPIIVCHFTIGLQQ